MHACGLTSTPWGCLLQAALFAAVRRPRRDERLAAIRAALEAGADVNARDSAGWCALEDAVLIPDAAAMYAVVQLLLAAGAAVRAKGDAGREPLQVAASNPNAEAVVAALRALAAAGGDVRAKTEIGREPQPERRGSRSSDCNAGGGRGRCAGQGQ